MASAHFYRLICTTLALGQFLLFASPVMAQQPNWIGDYRGYPSVRGYSAFPLAGITPRTTGPQYGYSAWRGSRRGTGAGTTIGMCMLGGIVGLGALSMGSQMLARRGMNKKHNNPNPPKDRIASKERRSKQEMKIRGELDQDYQKELAEKGIAMNPQGGNPLGMGASNMSGMSGMPAMSGMTSPARGGMGMGASSPVAAPVNQSFAPAMAPGQPAAQSYQPAPAFQAAPFTNKESVEGDVLNPLPWTPGDN